MKLPFTDKFLWNLFKLLAEGESSDLFAPRRIKTVCYPDFYKLQKLHEKEKMKMRLSQVILYLKKQGYIKIKNLKQKQGFILTKKGLEKTLKIKLKMIKKKRRADKKWEMIIFDIPENKRILRDTLRENLQLLDYKMLQKSIWVCPYDVLKETEEIIHNHSLDPYVKIFLIEEVEI